MRSTTPNEQWSENPVGTLCHLHSGCQGEVFRDFFDSQPHLTKRRASLQVPAVLYRAENTLTAVRGCHTQGHGCREKTVRPIRAYAATARARREGARDGMSKAALEREIVLRGDQVLRQAATYTLGCPKGRLRKLKPKTKRRAEAPSPV